MHVLDYTLWFPPATEADPSGLLAIGGNLHPQRLLLAYRQGIFPWYNEGEPIMWWSPDPRCVLFPPQLKISKSMQVLLRSNRFRFTQNKAFELVMSNCGAVNEAKHGGTWISPDMLHAYVQLHQQGYAHSAECWMDGTLVGGLYGIKLGGVFFGESMFSTVSNASKYAFIQFIQHHPAIGLIDCQIYSPHLASLGAIEIERGDFLQKLRELGAAGE
jgi:leucyl/phenylalanyl-tRNA--protein transferase